MNLADLITGFPPVLTTIFSAALGSFCVCAIFIIAEKEKKKKSTAGEVLLRFMVGWISGCFLGPLTAPGLQAIGKITDGTVSFIAGGGGYFAMQKVASGKADELSKGATPDETNTIN